jgi:nicotinamide mononucleotide transporter
VESLPPTLPLPQPLPLPLPAWLRPALDPAFTLLGSPVTGLEVFAFAAALAMVAANLRVHPVAWPLAIVSSLAYALLFADAKLYGEAGLQIAFVALALWGWWQWLRGRGTAGAPLVVHRLSRRGRVLAVGATLAAWPALALLLEHATDSTLPWWDALPTVASLTGQVLLARKVIENWPVWLCVNVVSVGLFAAKALWLTALLYAIFALLSVVGWRAWRRLEGRARA